MDVKINSDDDYNVSEENDAYILQPKKAMTLENAHFYDKFTLDYSYLKNKSTFIIDFSLLREYDSYLVVFIDSIKRELSITQIRVEIRNLSSEMEHFYNILTPKGGIERDWKRYSFWFIWISNIGNNTIELLKGTYFFLEFLGNLVLKLFTILFKPKKMRWKEFPLHFTQTGVNAVPITFLIVFLIGLISGYQGALQLSLVGADIFIADLIGISITRELAPLMTAIIVAGRSGSAFAAEIGTMKVSEEIDALRSMGFDVFYFLILPRVLAVMLVMPILVLITDVSGILGGLIAALSTLDITFAGYVNQLHRALDFADVFTGVGKSVVFGFLIGNVGCFMGLQVKGGAESVGKYTTTSVVTSIFLIILFDAIFTYIFSTLGI
jgi:phospholipid/cholesterol/gamma-HCH transport system permease protein